MNWSSVHAPGNPSALQGHPGTEQCEHVERGAKIVAIFAEDDSFGPVLRIEVCQSCVDASQEVMSYDPCRDCGKRKKVKDMIEWKWYDFYAPQGDEPIPVCRECLSGEKHRARVARDTRLALEEAGYYADDDEGEECSDKFDCTKCGDDGCSLNPNFDDSWYYDEYDNDDQ